MVMVSGSVELSEAPTVKPMVYSPSTLISSGSTLTDTELTSAITAWLCLPIALISWATASAALSISLTTTLAPAITKIVLDIPMVRHGRGLTLPNMKQAIR